jgi:hypothetical protein
VPTESTTLEREIDRIYGLPREEFTSARDELSKRLRSEGDREAAAQAKRLRKPSVAAWALNQVKRGHPERLNELIAAGQRLRDAQERLLASGERGLLRDAAGEERRLVEELVGLGEEQLRNAGHAPNAALRSKLWATAHAAAGNDEVRDLLASGRLVRDYEISDLGLPAGGSVPAPAKAPRPEPAKSGPDPAIQRKIRDLERRTERARNRQQETDEQRRQSEHRSQEAAARVAELETALAELRRKR